LVGIKAQLLAQGGDLDLAVREIEPLYLGKAVVGGTGIEPGLLISPMYDVRFYQLVIGISTA